jgi:hypothetical protein
LQVCCAPFNGLREKGCLIIVLFFFSFLFSFYFLFFNFSQLLQHLIPS